MTTAELEIRVKNLENEVALLKNHVGQTAWWEKITGSFKGDGAHQEAMRLGREYRLAQRAEEMDAEDDNS